MTDQDYDGSHIRGLLINMFHELWHTLLAVPGFLAYMATPIVKATKGKQVKAFYTQYEYEEWKKTDASRGWHVKYYKGLGTSTRDEAKEYFQKLNIMPYTYTGKQSDESIDLAFNKAKADDRKDWLKTYSREKIVTPVPALPYEEFVDKDLIHFSNYNLERSIPNVMDGLKTSQRKILFSAFKRNLKSELRVAQFAGYVSEHSGYHHGEASLNDAIVGMAQDFVGSNNIPWFVSQGQFGTRLQGGTDAASPRYIHTYLHPYVKHLVPEDDFACLKYRDDDGLPVEPEWYAPILPMLLVNGCRGIGTGYSTFVPQYNPADLKKIILKWLETGDGLDAPLVPWSKGFAGKMYMEDAKSCVLEGVWVVEKDVVVITELPVGTWTADVRETLDKMVSDGAIKDYTDTSTDTSVHMRVKGDVKALDKILKDKWKLTNMHAFNSKGRIQKYDTPNDILREYVSVRLELYETRRQTILKTLRESLPYYQNVVRFIRQQCEDVPRPDLRRKTFDDCHALLLAEKFTLIDGDYEYLMKLPISSLTLNNAQKHEKQLEELLLSISNLEAMTPKQMWKNELSKLSV
jgi:DNA topoisomerase-2